MQLLMFAAPMEMKAVAIRIDSKSTETCHSIKLPDDYANKQFTIAGIHDAGTVPVVQHCTLTTVCLCC